MKSNDTETQEWVRHTERMKALKRERLKLRHEKETLEGERSRLPSTGWLENRNPEQEANYQARQRNGAALMENEKQIMAESGYKF